MAKGIYEISKAVADFEEKYLNESNTDNLGNFWVVEYPTNNESSPSDLYYQTNVDSLILQSKGGLNEDDIYLITKDEQEAMNAAHDLVEAPDLNSDVLENELENYFQSGITEDIDFGIDDDNYQSDLNFMNTTFSPIDKIFDDFGGDRVYGYDDWYKKCNLLSVYGDELHFIPIQSGNAEICINTFNNNVLGVYSDKDRKDEGIVFGDDADIKVNTAKKYLSESKEKLNEGRWDDPWGSKRMDDTIYTITYTMKDIEGEIFEREFNSLRQVQIFCDRMDKTYGNRWEYMNLQES